jgi:hypothetical protein
MPLFVMASLIVASNFFAISFARASRDRECSAYGALLDQVKQDDVRARKNNPECPRCLCVDTAGQYMRPDLTITKRVARATSVARDARKHTTRTSLWSRVSAKERAFRKKFDRAYAGTMSYTRTVLRAIATLLPYLIGCTIGILAQQGAITVAIMRARDFVRNIRYHNE